MNKSPFSTAIILCAVALVTLIGICISQPIENELQSKTTLQQIVFVPYDVKYVPVEVTTDPSKKDKVIAIDPLKYPQPSKEDRETLFDLFEDKFDVDKSKSSEDYVLVPISILKNLEGDKTHIISKRQAPGVRPIIARFRPPAFVGYLNDYDRFPTVA